MKEIRYISAINEAIREEMERDENVFLMGEDVGVPGGSFGVSRGLYDLFGPDRVVDTPISEAAITGLAAGAAACGLRPILEIMFMDFMTVCMDGIVNQIAKMRYMFGSQYLDADFDASGTVDMSDLLKLVEDYFKSTDPMNPDAMNNPGQ